VSIRLKAFLIIISIVAAITVSCIALGLFFTKSQILKTIENDMLLTSALAEKTISKQVKILTTNASMAALDLNNVPDSEPAAALRNILEADDFFIAIAVFDSKKELVVSRNKHPAPELPADSKYIQRALAGETVISAASRDSGGETIFSIYVPMKENRVFSAAFRASLFNELLSKIIIWKTGGIFMIDEEGVMIAGRPEFMTPDRRGYITGDEGAGRYRYDGDDYFCVYKRISGAGVNWRIGAAAPLSESSIIRVQRLLGIMAALFFGLGIIAAYFASGNIVRPFLRIQEQNLRLEELKGIAQHASEAKSRFLANMSHEMRTPLNAVIGLSELSLAEQELPQGLEENLEKVYSSGLTLLGIVNDLLDISKIESGKFEIVPGEYDVPSLINDTINLNIIRIGSKPIGFRLLIDETLPSRLYGDELRVKQILNNLLSNAFKYTMKGSVALQISCREEDGVSWLTASVKDSGIGIRAEEQEKLFADYNRLDVRRTHNLEGTGLGLVLTKSMVELMGGVINVESEYGKGSTFTIRIQQKPVNAPPIGPRVVENLTNFRYSAQKRNRHTGLARIRLPYARVLVVDDVPINLDVARGMLKPYEMQIDCVPGGREAIDLIREHKVHYNAIFMDHMMPGMDGIEATEIIRKEIGTEYAKNIPIIVLTANAITGNEEMFLELGFDDFLSKPIDILRLDAVIHRWVKDTSRQ
jgi:signal transduction histidine kinase/CheY-like chemotaxis protein